MSLRNRIAASNVYLILSGGTEFLYALVFTVNLVYHVRTVGLDPFQIVLVGTLLEVVAFLGEIPTGVVADVYSRRLSILIGLFVVGTGFLIEGSFPNFGAILLSQLFLGIGVTFLSGAQQAWIADEVGVARVGQLFVRGAQIGSVGALLAAPLSVGLASIDLRVPIVAGGVLFILLGTFLALVMPEHGFAPAPREDRTTFHAMSNTFVEGTRAVRRRPILLTIIGISFFFGMHSEGFDRLWTPHMLEDFSLPSLGPLNEVVWFGIISVAVSLLTIVVNEIIRRRTDLTSHRAVTRLLFLSDGLLIAGLLVFALSGSFVLALAAYLLAATCRELHYPLSDSWANQSIDSNVRATVLSMNSQVNAFGQIAGGPLVGLIGRNVSIRAALTTSAAILLPALGLYGRAMGHIQPAEVEDETPVAAAVD